MKQFKYIMFFIAAACLLTTCEDGIDPVKPLDPGPDNSAPVVTVTSPANGLQIKIKEDLATITIRGEVRDDIELESVTISLDGRELITYREFKDYRRLVIEYTYTQVGNGPHVLAVTGKDKSGKTTTQTINFEKVEAYKPIYPGEIFYMPFELSNTDLVSTIDATRVGAPTFSPGKQGLAYTGIANGHLTFAAQNAAQDINLLNNEFSACFWYKFTTVAPDNRAGILSITPAAVAPATSGSRNFGFRLLREGGATNQKFNLNVGNGTADAWADGGAAATKNPTTDTDWMFIAFTISRTELAVFIDGEQVVRNSAFAGISWTGCTTLSIMSGRPNFIEWSHFSDLSLMDELRIFNKALTIEEIRKIMDDTK